MADEKITLYNRGKRKIVGFILEGRDAEGRIAALIDPATGKRIDYEFQPGRSLSIFNEPTAQYLREMFKGEVVSMEDVQQEFKEKGGDGLSADDLQARIDAAVEAKVAKILEERAAALTGSAESEKAADSSESPPKTQEEMDAEAERAAAEAKAADDAAAAKAAEEAAAEAAKSKGKGKK